MSMLDKFYNKFIGITEVYVKIKKLDDRAVIPFYKHPGEDMGMDITAIDVEYDAALDRFIYHTGLAFQLPAGFGMLIFPRSSNTKTEAYLANSVGILDSGYNGELLIIYKNRDFDVNTRPYEPGDRVAQIVILPYPQVNFTEVDELNETSRGADGGLIRK